MLRHLWHLMFTALIVGLVSASCARRTEGLAGDDSIGATPESNLVYSSGWKGLEMITWGSDVTVDASVGHFMVGRNGCYQKEFGALKVRDWNDLTNGINKAISDGFLEKENCMPYVHTAGSSWDLDGTVDVKLSNDKKQSIFYARFNEVCTQIKNPEVAQKTLTALNRFLIQAAHEGCPNARQ